MIKKICLLIFIYFILIPLCLAQTVYLKSGKQIQGKVIEKTDKYIKVDFYGVPLTYFLDEVDKISDGEVVRDEKATQEALIKEVLDYSGVGRQISQFADIVSLGAEQNLYSKLNNPEAVREKIAIIIKEAYKTEKMYPIVVSVVKRKFNNDNLQFVLTWLKSPLAKKITSLEEDASRPESVRKIQEFAIQLQSREVAPDRLALIKELDASANVTTQNINIVLVSTREMLKAIDSSMPPEKRSKGADLDSMLASMKTSLEPQMKTDTLVSLLYTYQDLNDDEIKYYVDFWKAKEGKWFNEVISEAILTAIASASKEAGSEIAREASNREKL